jgi:hypothetical protein
MDGRYYPMRPDELTTTGLRPWLLGHTHVAFPRAPAAGDTIFCAGTPEPDGFDCAHEGSGWALELNDEGTVRARAVKTGLLRFVEQKREVRTREDLEQIEKSYADSGAESALLRLHLEGRAARDVLAEIGALRARMAESFLYLDVRAEELREEITAEAIDREYPAGSFPHALLTSLYQDDDQDALRIAHELLGELRS